MQVEGEINVRTLCKLKVKLNFEFDATRRRN